MARNKIASKKVNLANSEVVFSFHFPDGDRSATVGLSELEGLKAQLALHGLSQKLGDAYAGAKSASEAFQSFNDQLEVLRTVGWTKERGGAPEEGTLLTQAVMRFINAIREKGGKPPIGVAEAAQWLESKSDEEIAGIRKDPRIVKHIGDIRTERAEAAAREAGPSILDSVEL